MNDRIASDTKLVTFERSMKAAACTRNIVTNTRFLPIASENQAQRKRPAPLAIEMMPTRPAAFTELTWEISWAIGDACEMMAIPATVFRNSTSQSPYHCHVRAA